MRWSKTVIADDPNKKIFVRPVRRTFTHLVCNRDTTIGQLVAEKFAEDPAFYGIVFCVRCMKTFPVKEFVWAGTKEAVGS